MFVPKWKLLAATGRILLNDAGESGGGGNADPAADPAAAAAAAKSTDADADVKAPKPGPPSTDTGTKTDAKEWDGEVASLPQGVQDMIKGLRTESAEKRTKATAAEKGQRDAIVALAKAAGIEVPEGENNAPSVEDLTSSLTASQQSEKTAAIELAVYRAAKEHGGSPTSLTDSRAFMTKVAELDPRAEDFSTKVTEAAKAAVAANPSLRSAPAAGSSTADHPGGTGEGDATQEQFDRMSPGERNELFNSDPILYRKLTGRQ